MSNITVNGTQKFMGIDIPVIEGGFGENQKCVLAKTVAEIHKVELKVINQLINNNIAEFDSGVDIIDLKNSVITNDPLFEIGFSKQSIANSTNIYLLSEQGYMALVTLMRTPKAREIRKQFRREYFSMREVIKENLYDGISPELKAIIMHDKKIQAVETRVEKLENNMTIDYAQQEELRSTANRVVLDALGGKASLAYKMIGSKAFAEFWRDYKRYMNVNSYKNTAVLDFERAREYVLTWTPNKELRLMILGANTQMHTA